MKILNTALLITTLSLSACGGSGTEDCVLLIQEDIIGDVTVEEGCYIAQEDLLVDKGLLTLEPGVKIIFSREVRLTIEGDDGALSAQGTAEKRVILTGEDQEAGSWTGVYFNNSASSENLLDYTTIEFGGGEDLGGLGNANLAIGAFVGFSQIAIKNTIVRGSSGFGIVVKAGSAFSSFEKNQFSNTSKFALSIRADQRAIVDGASTFEGALPINGIEIYGGEVTEASTWTAVSGDAFTSITDLIDVMTDLTIAENVVLEFGDNVGFNVLGRKNGTLVCAGKTDEPVLFTGATKEPGFWKGIYFDNSTASVNHLDRTIVEYGGSSEIGSGLGKVNVGIGGFVGTSTIKIDNSTFRHSAGYGIQLELENEILSFTGNTFENNEDYAIRIPAEVRKMVDETTTFLGSSTSYVEIFASSVTSEATWKNLSESAFTSVTGDLGTAARLELNPGVELHFGDNIQFTVQGRTGDGGSLIAKGTDVDPIIFTRLGAVQWKGIYFDNSDSSENEISDAIIEYGGFSEIDGTKANLFIGGFVGTSALNVTNVTISNSAGVGILIESGNTVNADIATANQFSNNADGNVVSE